MKTEIEAKFLSIDHAGMRERLIKIGAECLQPMRLMKRAIIDFPDRRLQEGEVNSFIRVREEGNKITLTYKQFNAKAVDGAQEIETTVDSFEDTVDIFLALGLEVVSLQESKRETWEYQEYEIVLDEWPWLQPFIEIEGGSEEGLKAVSEKLGLEWSNAVFGGVMGAYRVQYPHIGPNDTVGNLKEVRFDSPIPQFLIGE